MEAKELCYKTSRDMNRLIELLDAGYEVVCFITYDFTEYRKDEPGYKPMMTTDICIARYTRNETYGRYSIGVRGHLFIEYWTDIVDYKYTFLELLEAHDIQFIEPTTIKES